MLHRFLRRFNHYELLGVSYDAHNLQIKQAFYKLAKKYHPDASSEQSEEKFKEITEAYKVLSDPELRRLYDQKLESGQIPLRKDGASAQPKEEEPQVNPDESPYQKAYMSMFDAERRKKLREFRLETLEHEKIPIYRKTKIDISREVGMYFLILGAIGVAIFTTLRAMYVPKKDLSLAKEIDDELMAVRAERHAISNITQHKI